MATQSELAQIQHILGKRRNLDQNPLDLSARKKSREYLDSHKDVEKRRRDRINTCLDIIRSLVPLCHQLPRHRRVDKADLLDLAIIYLRMVNQFLEKLGVNDIFSAAHQQVALFSSLEKFVKDQGEKSQDVPSFTKEILSYLESEVETVSHVIASQQSAGNPTPGSENGFLQNSDWMKHEQPGLDGDMSGPRSYPTSSGSDEERSQGSYKDRESRSSGSEDSMSVGSPYGMYGMDFPRRGSQSSIMEGNDGPFPFSGKNHAECRRSSSGYDSSGCQNIQRTKCVDKAVNTDASSSNFTWPPDVTFTLPILSGKIVLHSPLAINGANNLNASVTLHADIDSSQAFQSHPSASDVDKTYPATDGKGCPKRVSEANASSGSSPPCSTGSKQSVKDTSFNHKTSFNNENGVSSRSQVSPKRKTSHDINVVPVPSVPMVRPDRYCLQPGRHNPPNDPEEAYCSDETEVKSYTSLVPLRRSSEERNTRYIGSLSQRSAMAQSSSDDSDSNYSDERNGSFFKRYVDVLEQSQERNDNSGRNKSCNCCTNTSSSLKLKSLMVHRHQTQHVMSR